MVRWVCMIDDGGECYEFAPRRETREEALKDAKLAVASLHCNIWISELIQELDPQSEEDMVEPDKSLCDYFPEIRNALEAGSMRMLLAEQNKLLERRRDGWNKSIQRQIQKVGECYKDHPEQPEEEKQRRSLYLEQLRGMLKNEPTILTEPVILKEDK